MYFQLKNVRERLAKNLTEKGVLTTEKQVTIRIEKDQSPSEYRICLVPEWSVFAGTWHPNTRPLKNWTYLSFLNGPQA